MRLSEIIHSIFTMCPIPGHFLSMAPCIAAVVMAWHHQSSFQHFFLTVNHVSLSLSSHSRFFTEYLTATERTSTTECCIVPCSHTGHPHVIRSHALINWPTFRKPSEFLPLKIETLLCAE
ncbi:uncharacterized protein ACHE_41232S [Aspergillus chevalieri]|uniref:Uncharacterized protein n=1 Tax=Aspergillus chevalieri TaxID=182096 RepID=A0A7R7ZNL8_ASPCH|nr:uncharacterized protein ACHE_41232S [Aspergillus chevalieri]BCR88668.1 hypothetical protein ACHE_41232S [Aspergillus chevalieri]